MKEHNNLRGKLFLEGKNHISNSKQCHYYESSYEIFLSLHLQLEFTSNIIISLLLGINANSLEIFNIDITTLHGYNTQKSPP